MIFKQCSGNWLWHAKAVASLSLATIFFLFSTWCCGGIRSEIFAITHRVNWLLLLKHFVFIIHCWWCSYWRSARGHFCRQRWSIYLICNQLLRLSMMASTQVNVDCFESCMALIKHLQVKLWHFFVVICGIVSSWFNLLLLILHYLNVCMKMVCCICASCRSVSGLTLITLCLI